MNGNQETEKQRKEINYKLLMIPPILLLILCLGFLILQTSTTGLNLDIDLKGGTQISIESSTSVSETNLENILKEYDADVRIARGFAGYSILIDFPSDKNPKDIIDTLKNSGYDFKDYSVQSVEPALGVAFFTQAQIALVLAFVFMAITIFIIFRILMPSFYVVLCGFADIIETLAISQIFGINLSLATFAALLLLIGYSVDTDVLLTTRVLKREGILKGKIHGAMKTGITMIGTAAVALVGLYIISGSSIITQIASILLIGILIDIPNTWWLNAGLLRWYIERKERKVIK